MDSEFRRVLGLAQQRLQRVVVGDTSAIGPVASVIEILRSLMLSAVADGHWFAERIG